MTATTRPLEPSFVDLIVAIDEAHATGAVPERPCTDQGGCHAAQLAVAVRVNLNFQFHQPLADLIDEYFMTSGQRCRLPSIKVKLIDESNTQRADEASDES